MKKAILMILLTLFPAIAMKAEAGMTAKEIIDKAETKAKGESMVGQFTMKVIRPDYTRTLEMKTWNKGNEKSLIVITAPKKEAGNKTLKIGNEMWTYLKTTETTMKLPASMLLQSWNGSDLTNDDMVRESKLIRDYDLRIMFEEQIAGEMCWKIELTPKPDAPVVWGKLYYWVRKSDYNPALVQYYDEKGKLHRVMKFTDIKELDGRKIPSRWVIIDKINEGESTEFIFDEVKFDVKIPDRIFSLRELER